jgi:hypothetical protein
MRLGCSSSFYLTRHEDLKETLAMMERVPGRGNVRKLPTK